MRIRAAGVNHFDHDIREGISGITHDLPHVLGVEGVGDGRGQGVFPQARRLLGPSRLRIVGPVGAGCLAENAQIIARDDGFETLGADIDADDGDGRSPARY